MDYIRPVLYKIEYVDDGKQPKSPLLHFSDYENFVHEFTGECCCCSLSNLVE